jgi:hypothetical protein
VNTNGTYDIRFEDGERKRGITEAQIEGGGDDRDHDSRDHDRDSGSSKKRREGDKVKAKCSGWTKYYSGEITRVNTDGTPTELTTFALMMVSAIYASGSYLHLLYKSKTYCYSD